MESWRDLRNDPLAITNGRLKPRAGSWPRAPCALGRARLAEDPWAGPVMQGLAYSCGEEGHAFMCVVGRCADRPPNLSRLVEEPGGGPGVVRSAGDSAELVFPGLAGGVEGWAGPSPLLLGVMGP